MELGERPPKQYNQGKIQALFERVVKIVRGSEERSKQFAADQSKEISQKYDQKLAQIEEQIGSETGENQGPPQQLPTPQNLTVFELGLWGFAHIDPFQRWKYIGKLVGYEFYGSPNSGFSPEGEPYTQTGVHYKKLVDTGETYLNTEHPSDDSLSHVLDWRLIKLGANQLTLENLTQGTSDVIEAGAYKLSNPKYQIKADSVTWDDGDEWRIKNYPQNKLFNIGSFAVFPKRLGNFYVVARSMGKGKSFSAFTEEETSTGLTSTGEITAPTFVQPWHLSNTPEEQCTIVGGEPVCNTHGSISWEDVGGGCRETDHFSLFGFEWCNVEIVYNEVDTDEFLLYKCVREATGEEDESEVS